jgi:hypothetical protein
MNKATSAAEIHTGILLILGIYLHDAGNIEIARIEEETNHGAAIIHFAVGGGDDAGLLRRGQRGRGIKRERRSRTGKCMDKLTAGVECFHKLLGGQVI